jgi:peptidoglycan-associated lipoprotein
MSKKLWIGLLLLLIIPGFLFSGCCPKKKVPVEPMVAEPAPVELAPEPVPAPSPAPPPVSDENLEAERAAAAKRRAMQDRNRFITEDINFDFDKYNIRPDAQEILIWKADWMRRNPNVNVLIEGHCDERGTAEYNLALGERRAESAKAFLINLGVPGSRMSTVSYGEEKPLDPRSNEEAWAKNRRGHFEPKN